MLQPVKGLEVRTNIHLHHADYFGDTDAEN